MTLKNTKIIAAALSLGLVLTACGNNNAENTAEEPASTETTDTAETTETEETADEAEEKEEETDTANAEDYDFSVVSREDGSGTRGAFIELVGLEAEEGGETKDLTTNEAVVQNSTNGVMQTVSQDPTAIGYVSLGSVNDSVQKVKVDGAEATEENIESGDYNLQRPFNLAFKKDSLDELAQDFLDFCLSDDAQNIASEEGYIKVETKDYESKEIEGDLTIAGSTSVTPLMEKLVEKYKEGNPKANIEIQSTGSSAGIESTISDVSQIAMASRELKEDESKELDVEVIARDGIAVVVNNEDTKMSDLTQEELKQIFSGEITNTSELN